MTVCIVGHKGNMGRRYASILNFLGEDWFGLDIEEGISQFCDTYIITTPTDTHVDIICDILEEMNPHATILCEKPIATDLVALNRIPKENWDDIFMVNQYAYTSDFVSTTWPPGITSYNFYHSGKDGIAWDCIQLIYLAKEKHKIILNNTSPVWKAVINGWPLGKEEIDHSYIDMIKDFLGSKEKSWNLHKAYEAHKDVLEYLETQKND